MNAGMADLNGWTAGRLDDLARDVREIKKAVEAMQSDELRQLRDDLRDAERRPKMVFTTYLAAIVPSIITSIVTITILLAHG